MGFEDDNLSVSSNFDRSFKFQRDVDMGQVSAKFTGGVLTVTAPKVERKENVVRSLEIDVVENLESEESSALMAQEEVAGKRKSSGRRSQLMILWLILMRRP